MRERVIELIERERQHSEAGTPGRIVAKMNSLVEPSVIDALYRASQAGVRIDLVVRGICCLRPGIPGVSENIRVTSIVDKFLEHTRIFYYENAGNADLFLSSADWMPRNFFRRIEVLFPVEDNRLKARIIEEILPIVLADNVKARVLQPDGSYVRTGVGEGQSAVRSQMVFQSLAREAARDVSETARQFVPILRRPRVVQPEVDSSPAAERSVASA
jgi:polyphosphate kinase